MQTLVNSYSCRIIYMPFVIHGRADLSVCNKDRDYGNELYFVNNL